MDGAARRMKAGCCSAWQRRRRGSHRTPVEEDEESKDDAARRHDRVLCFEDDGGDGDARGEQARDPERRRPRRRRLPETATAFWQSGADNVKEDRKEEPEADLASNGSSTGSLLSSTSSLPSSASSSASSAASSLGGESGPASPAAPAAAAAPAANNSSSAAAAATSAAAAATATATAMKNKGAPRPEEPHERLQDQEQEVSPDETPVNVSLLTSLLMTTASSTNFLPMFSSAEPFFGADNDNNDDDDDDAFERFEQEEASLQTPTRSPPALLRSQSSASMSSATHAPVSPLSMLSTDGGNAARVEPLSALPSPVGADDVHSECSALSFSGTSIDRALSSKLEDLRLQAAAHELQGPVKGGALRRGVAAPPLINTILSKRTDGDVELAWTLVAAFLSARDVSALGALNTAWQALARSWPLRLDTVWPPRPAADILRDLGLARATRRAIGGVRLLCGLDQSLFQAIDPAKLVFLHISGLGLERTPTGLYQPLDLSSFASLQDLRLDDLFISALEPVVACAPTLRSLRLRRCTNLSDLSGFKTTAFPHLRCLEIRDCRLLTSLATVSHLAQLRTLALSGLDRAKGIVDDIRGCTKLTHLSISRSSEVTSLRALQDFPELTHLDLTHLPSLQSVPSELSYWCPLLTEINFSSCSGLQILPPLAALERLELLIVSNTRIMDLECVRGAVSLRRLDAAFCFRLVSIAALATVRDLRCISLRFCQALRTVTALAYCKRLVWVDLSETKVPRQPVVNVATVISEKSAGLLATRPQLPRW